jgi:glycosyltransferase involved in cell wall biosynthesis
MNNVTVIAPVVNRPTPMISKLLYSLENQSQGVDAILVDFGSKGWQLAEYRSVCRDTSTLLIEVKRNTEVYCQGRALNIGIRAAQTQWVVTTDCDSVFASNFVYVAQQAFEKQAKALVLCRRTNLDSNGVEIGLAGQEYQGSCIGLSRDWLCEVQGHDEFYLNWGSIDNCTVSRACHAGFTPIWITERTRVCHQFHEPQTRITTDINTEYRLRMEGVIVRNGKDWGKI